MKRFFATLSMVTLMTVVGCGDKSKPGGPGATGSDSNKPVVGQGDNTFSLDVPNSLSLKQGESKTETITIKRGKNFDQDVTLTFDKLPAGVTATPANPMLKKSETEVKVTLAAGLEAALTDATVIVRGKPATGAEATSEMKVSIKKAD